MDFHVIDLDYTVPEKPKVMVVDDEPTMHSLLIDTIGDDYRVMSAFNGRESLAEAQSAQPSLILMDVMMPDMGGYEAVRILQGNDLTKNIPILMMSAVDFDPTTKDVLRREPNVKGFLTKPFRPKQIREVIKTFIIQKD